MRKVDRCAERDSDTDEDKHRDKRLLRSVFTIRRSFWCPATTFQRCDPSHYHYMCRGQALIPVTCLDYRCLHYLPSLSFQEGQTSKARHLTAMNLSIRVLKKMSLAMRTSEMKVFTSIKSCIKPNHKPPVCGGSWCIHRREKSSQCLKWCCVL